MNNLAIDSNKAKGLSSDLTSSQPLPATPRTRPYATGQPHKNAAGGLICYAAGVRFGVYGGHTPVGASKSPPEGIGLISPRAFGNSGALESP